MNGINYEEMTDAQLRELLRQDLEEEITLDTDTILTIAGILAKHAPPRRSPEEAWESFCKHYLPETENDL